MKSLRTPNPKVKTLCEQLNKGIHVLKTKTDGKEVASEI